MITEALFSSESRAHLPGTRQRAPASKSGNAVNGREAAPQIVKTSIIDRESFERPNLLERLGGRLSETSRG